VSRERWADEGGIAANHLNLGMKNVMERQRYECMRHIAPLVLAVAAIGISCSKPKPTVVLDSWWSTDVARTACMQANQWRRDNAALVAQVGCAAVTACPEMMARVEACVADPALEVRGFETELATQLAADPRCDAVQFVIFNGPTDSHKTASNAMQGPHWSLQLDFEPGARKQPWSMPRSPDLNAFTKGVGDPKEIAATVCAVVKERGAKLLN